MVSLLLLSLMAVYGKESSRVVIKQNIQNILYSVMTFSENIQDFFERNFIRILRLIIGFLRLLGFTYGGLTIDSKGRLKSSKFWKYYGLIVTTILLAIFCGHLFATLLGYKYSYNFDMIITSKVTGEKHRQLIWFIIWATTRGWELFKIYSMYYFNQYGFEFIKLVNVTLKDKSKHLKDYKTLFVLAYWIMREVRLKFFGVF